MNSNHFEAFIKKGYVKRDKCPSHAEFQYPGGWKHKKHPVSSRQGGSVTQPPVSLRFGDSQFDSPFSLGQDNPVRLFASAATRTAQATNAYNQMFHPATPAANSIFITSSIGIPTTFVKLPSSRSTNLSADSCMAYAPALPIHSPKTMYCSISSGDILRIVT